jgi:long-subunit fatty acid transport protein
MVGDNLILSIFGKLLFISMKKILGLILSIAPLISFGQVEKGMWLLSGNASFQKNPDNGSISVTPTSVTSIQLTPYAGYMVSSKIAVGLSVNYLKSKFEFSQQNQASLSNSEATSFTAGPFIRYYQPITEKFFFFAQGDVMFGKGTSDLLSPTSGTINKDELTSTAVALRPGVAYFISKRWAFEVVLGSIMYSNRSYKSGGSSTNVDGFAFNFITRGLSPGILFTF